MADILDTIVQVPYDSSNYIKATYPKDQIVLHHTVSNGSAIAVSDYWKRLGKRIGTCIVVDKEGIIHQLFSSRYYAGHIGNVSDEMQEFNLPYRSCSKTSIGVELVNMGGLTKKEDGKLYNAYGGVFNGEFVHYPNGYRGYKYFAKYTNEQIESLRRILIYWCNRYDIPKTYNDDIWSTNVRALSGEKGIFTHTSFRFDKSDLHPDSNLIKMLKSL